MFNGQPPGHRLVPTDYAPAMRALYGKGAVPPPRPSAAFLASRATAVPPLAAPDLLPPKADCPGPTPRPPATQGLVPGLLPAGAPQPRRPRWQLMARPAARATAADLTALDRAGALY